MSQTAEEVPRPPLEPQRIPHSCVHWPEWDLDGDVAVDSDGQQAEDGALGEDQHKAGDEQAAVEVGAETGANDNGEGNGQDAHGDVGHCQRHHKEIGDALKVAVEAHGPTDQHIAQHREHGDQQLQDDVDDEGFIGVWHGDTSGEGGNLTSKSIAVAWQPLSSASSPPALPATSQAGGCGNSFTPDGLNLTQTDSPPNPTCGTLLPPFSPGKELCRCPVAFRSFTSATFSHEPLEGLTWCQQCTSLEHYAAGDKGVQKWKRGNAFYSNGSKFQHMHLHHDILRKCWCRTEPNTSWLKIKISSHQTSLLN